MNPSEMSIQTQAGQSVEGPTWAKPCQRCGREVQRWRGQAVVSCSCGAWYNAGGQHLRDDWADNPAWQDDEVDDLEGFERQQLAREEEHGPMMVPGGGVPMTTLGALEFRCRRKALGLSREELAERLGVKNATVAKWEAGRSRIPAGVGDELSELERFCGSLMSAYQRAGRAYGRIMLAREDAESGLHMAAAAGALAALRDEGLPMTITPQEPVTREKGHDSPRSHDGATEELRDHDEGDAS